MINLEIKIIEDPQFSIYYTFYKYIIINWGYREFSTLKIMTITINRSSLY